MARQRSPDNVGKPVYTRAIINQTRLELIRGDITQQDTDAIVNAANSSLLGGGGVDGAIHRAAGPQLLAATRQLGGCPTGEARITGGYKLRAAYVIHAVGPVYRRGDASAPLLLASAYRSSLALAVENQLDSIAFPSISTGAYGYPLDEAAPVALETVYTFVCAHDQLRLVRFVLFDDHALQRYAAALTSLVSAHQSAITLLAAD
jgi:O-acetyl-ADP-ribose deacetylase (regulator of RNase III)